jgi:hypothetical protein
MTKKNITSNFIYKRNGYRWSIPEIIRLQREFELLELNIEEISIRHQRSPYAIANRLVDEGFASQECKEVSQYLGFIPYNNTDTIVSQDNISLSISEESRSDITNDSENEISTLKSQVSDLNTKLDSILSMLKRSNGGSIIGMY